MALISRIVACLLGAIISDLVESAPKGGWQPRCDLAIYVHRRTLAIVSFDGPKDDVDPRNCKMTMYLELDQFIPEWKKMDPKNIDASRLPPLFHFIDNSDKKEVVPYFENYNSFTGPADSAGWVTTILAPPNLPPLPGRDQEANEIRLIEIQVNYRPRTRIYFGVSKVPDKSDSRPINKLEVIINLGRILKLWEEMDAYQINWFQLFSPFSFYIDSGGNSRTGEEYVRYCHLPVTKDHVCINGVSDPDEAQPKFRQRCDLAIFVNNRIKALFLVSGSNDSPEEKNTPEDCRIAAHFELDAFLSEWDKMKNVDRSRLPPLFHFIDKHDRQKIVPNFENYGSRTPETPLHTRDTKFYDSSSSGNEIREIVVEVNGLRRSSLYFGNTDSPDKADKRWSDARVSVRLETFLQEWNARNPNQTNLSRLVSYYLFDFASFKDVYYVKLFENTNNEGGSTGFGSSANVLNPVNLIKSAMNGTLVSKR